MVNNLPASERRPIHEILTRVAAVISPDIANQLPDLEINEIKTALEAAAAVMNQQGAPSDPGVQQSDAETSLQEMVDLDPNKILVVDDVKENLFLIEYLFRNTGFSLSLVSNAEEALAKARAELPILIISDIMMPEMSGFELLMALKTDERTKNIGVILVTAHHRSSEEVSEGLKMGADDYIYRPFVRDEFMSRVEAVLRLKRAEVENVRLLQSAQELVDDLIALTEIGRALTSTLDLKQILKQTTLLVQQALQADATSVWLIDESGKTLELIAASGVGAAIVTGYRMPIEYGIAGYVAKTGELYLVADLSTDERHYWHVAEISNYRPRSILAVPVQVKGEVIGVMQALHQNVDWFNEDDLRLAGPIASSVGIAVDNARLFGKVQAFSQHLEQKVAERTMELAEEKEKTEAILKSMADGLLVLDADDCILIANGVAEKMLNFRLSELTGRPVGPEKLEHPLWRCISDIAGSAESTVTALVDVPSTQGKGESPFSIQAQSAKVRNESDQIIGTVITLRDLTALKEVERMKARFVTGVTHELKTPLAVIQLHTGNLLNYHDRLPVHQRNDLLHSIQAQTLHLGQLIEDILALSRLDLGVSTTARQSINLVELTDQVVNALRPLAEAKQVRLVWAPPNGGATTWANHGQLEQVIRNLIDNAIKYTPPGGSVTVQAFSNIGDEGNVQIQVSDTGLGIPREHQAQVFERFHRVDPSHTIPGTGLGLAIVKEVVEAYGGNVSLVSNPGKGSTFTITFPGIDEKGG